MLYRILDKRLKTKEDCDKALNRIASAILIFFILVGVVCITILFKSFEKQANEERAVLSDNEVQTYLYDKYISIDGVAHKLDLDKDNIYNIILVEDTHDVKYTLKYKDEKLEFKSIFDLTDNNNQYKKVVNSDGTAIDKDRLHKINEEFGKINSFWAPIRFFAGLFIIASLILISTLTRLVRESIQKIEIKLSKQSQ